MDKETARKILQSYIDTLIGLYGSFTLPIEDVVIYTSSTDTYTWKYLIKIAYS